MAAKKGSTGDEGRDMTGREVLLENSLPQLFDAHDRARDDGVQDAVVFLVDCEDEIGGQIARAWEGDDAVDSAIMANSEAAAEAGESLTTTLARPVPFDECRQEVPKFFPYLKESFETPPSDGFLVVVVSFGGAGTFAVPLSARPPQ